MIQIKLVTALPDFIDEVLSSVYIQVNKYLEYCCSLLSSQTSFCSSDVFLSSHWQTVSLHYHSTSSSSYFFHCMRHRRQTMTAMTSAAIIAP